MPVIGLLVIIVAIVSVAKGAHRSFQPGCESVRNQWLLLWGLTAAMVLVGGSLTGERQQQGPDLTAKKERHAQARWECGFGGKILSMDEAGRVWECQKPDGSIEWIQN